jgi:hypothetical protein
MAAQSSRSRDSVSRHRLLRAFQFIAPGGKAFSPLRPGARPTSGQRVFRVARRGRFPDLSGAGAKAHHRFHALKSEFDGPAAAL